MSGGDRDMEHLTQEQINKLTYFYLNRKILSDDLLEAKKHMVQCSSCYEEFCVSIVEAHELAKKGLIDLKILVNDNDDTVRDNTLVRMNSVAGKLQVAVNRMLDHTKANLWSFVPEPQFAAARGQNSNDMQIFVNQISEYSFISLQGDNLIVRLDVEYFKNEKYEAVYYENGKEKIYPFLYNEVEECLEVVIKVKDSDYELIIRECVL